MGWHSLSVIPAKSDRCGWAKTLRNKRQLELAKQGQVVTKPGKGVNILGYFRETMKKNWRWFEAQKHESQKRGVRQSMDMGLDPSV